MAEAFQQDYKLGILGGGQLGKMLCEAASPFHINTHILDADENFPAAKICHQFTKGNFKNYDDVVAFGQDKDVITIEIESVNLEAIIALEQQGIKVYPQSHVLEIITDKGIQKDYYKTYNLPTSHFELFDNRNQILAAINSEKIKLPFVQKLRKDGYDGRGVKLVRTKEDLNNLLSGPSLIEDLVDIEKEIGVMVARSPSGEIVVYDPVEMVFDPEANLVDYLIAPALITNVQSDQIKEAAKTIISQMDMVGILAIEWFLDKKGHLLINEMAPRTHNSGHHTIEACACSQFEQHLRAVLDLPLGDTSLRNKAIMVNLLGEDGQTGPAKYEGISSILSTKEAHIHIYGKAVTKPQRKMGHLTILGEDVEELKEMKNEIKKKFRIISD